jgi:hypothetical protein
MSTLNGSKVSSLVLSGPQVIRLTRPGLLRPHISFLKTTTDLSDRTDLLSTTSPPSHLPLCLEALDPHKTPELAWPFHTHSTNLFFLFLSSLSPTAPPETESQIAQTQLHSVASSVPNRQFSQLQQSFEWVQVNSQQTKKHRKHNRNGSNTRHSWLPSWWPEPVWRSWQQRCYK